MKFIYYLFICLLIFSCKGTETADEEVNCIGDYSTAGILVDINEEIYNDDESVNIYSRYSWTSDGIIEF